MKLSEFDYKLPFELIAQEPLKERSASRMLVLDKKNGSIKHDYFYNMPQYLNANDTVVINDTKVFKARLIGNRKGFTGKIELLLLSEKENGIFKCLAKPAKRLLKGTELEFGDKSLTCKIIDEEEEFRYVQFDCNGNLQALLDKFAFVPLPPYIKRIPDDSDIVRYQTVFAKNTGAIAAPTAGLHFSEDTLIAVKKKGANIAYITLHVGYGTFMPVKVENILEHKIHSEHFEVSKEAADEINKTKKQNGRILAIGTTVCRTLESAAVLFNNQYAINNKQAETELFIYPGYDFKITDMLLTNFHLPNTTLIMLACAFGGYENTMKAYKEAVERKYRFYSYGDCMLIK